MDQMKNQRDSGVCSDWQRSEIEFTLEDNQSDDENEPSQTYPRFKAKDVSERNGTSNECKRLSNDVDDDNGERQSTRSAMIANTRKNDIKTISQNENNCKADLNQTKCVHLHKSLSCQPFGNSRGYELCYPEAPISCMDPDVINRCDDLIKQFQNSSLTYFKLERAYQKTKKRFNLLAIGNVFLYVSIAVAVILVQFGDKVNDRQSTVNDNSDSTDYPFQICFNCSDLHQGTEFSLETLSGILQRDVKCCFDSAMSIMRSLNRNFLKNLDEKLEPVKKQIYLLGKKLLQLEVDAAPDKTTIIGNILQVIAPREPTALYLTNKRDTLFIKTSDVYKLNKLRWATSNTASIKRGSLELSEDGTSIRVTSEAYYFFYTRIKFKHKEKTAYNRQTPLRYLVYRLRGSIPAYIHEATINCVFNEMSQEHSSTSEMILHLNRDDEIFVTVEDSDKMFLSTDEGAHSVGLFEI